MYVTYTQVDEPGLVSSHTKELIVQQSIFIHVHLHPTLLCSDYRS